MNALERGLMNRFAEIEDLSSITQGLVLDVHLRGKRVALLDVGQTYRYYDLASLTKILFSASVGIQHFSRHPQELDQTLGLSWWKRRTTPRDLLTHTAGLEWWVPMYKKLKGPMDPQLRWEQLKRQLARTKPKRRPKAVYSDLDLWLFGAYLENRLEDSLLNLWFTYSEHLEIRDMFFHPGNTPAYSRRQYAPTEDDPWRGRVLQGEVHDENGWALGGVAPHTGLFGTPQAVSEWGLKLRANFLGEREYLGSTRMVRHFVGRRIPREIGDWGLGFMKPSKGRASCGRHFSLKSFGHTGFTGTSYWYDPIKDLQVVILSNRVHPTRTNTRFVQLRPRIHDWVCEELAR